LAYAGHQFGHFVPQLGDGRAILLGEVIDTGGRRRDIQLKGSGQTRFSRRGDGRAALGPVIREYIVSEAMHHLGVPTTRALAIVTTGEHVVRDAILPGAILTRVASGHVRVGTFEYFSARQDREAIKILADYVIERHYPDARQATMPYVALLEAVIQAKTRLVAEWMRVGFIHGVMNTDNTAISGETIDYGPCAFMDEYDPQTVFSSIDDYGRYAFGNQANIAALNLSSFAACLLFLLHEDQTQALKIAQQSIEQANSEFEQLWQRTLCRKIGLNQTSETDIRLASDYLSMMHEHDTDYTLGFRRLSLAVGHNSAPSELLALFPQGDQLAAWLERWRQRYLQLDLPPQDLVQAMDAVNPAFIPRNHRVEQAIRSAIDHGDFSPMSQLIDVLSRPYDYLPKYAEYTNPPAPQERVTQTFCGT
jgi:uncharacterized protein YdiU (UPF0061 family)